MRKKPFPISRKLRIILIAETLLLLCAYILLSSAYSKLNKHHFDNVIEQLNYTIQSNLRHTINTLDVSTKFPISHTAVKYRNDELWGYLENPQRIQEERVTFNRAFTDRCEQTLFQFPSLDSIYMMDIGGNIMAYGRSELFSRPLNDSADYSWLEEVKAGKGKLLLLSHEKAKELGYAPMEIMYGVRMLSSTNTLKPLCIILNGIRLNDLAADFHSQRIYDDQQLALFDRDGALIYKSGAIPDDLFSSRIASPSDSVVKHVSDDVSYTCHIDYETASEIYSVIQTPTSELYRNNWSFYLLFGLLIPLVILFNLLIFRHNVKSISEPLNLLVSACQKIGDGDFSVRIKTSSSNELGYVINSFNLMSEQVEKLINEVLLRNIARQDLELQMLRSQINPHFLYNTLESMRMAAYAEGYTDYAEMCRLLAKILRYGVATQNHLVTVGEELEHLKDYISLLEYRFHDRIKVQIQISPDIMDTMIIKLILQPLVENCINHGIIGMNTVGYIQIWGYRQEDMIIFTVTDNGNGMDEENLRLLQGYLNNENEAFTSIGLKNIHRRIQLYYGSEYGLTINSKPGKGTSVTIHFPFSNGKITESEQKTAELNRGMIK